MGLFDFLKKKKPSPEPPNETPLEVALRLASGDAAYHKAFYQELLRSKLIVLTASEAAPLGNTTLSAGDTLQLVALTDGSIPVFSEERRIFDGEQAGQSAVRATKLEARALLETTQGATLVLNPFSEFTKVLVPEEVERLLDGRIFGSHETITVAQPTAIRMGKPAVYPTALVEELQRLFQARAVVQRAYLAWCHIPSDGRPPHAMIGLEVTGGAEALIKEAGAIARTVLPDGEVVDFIVMDPAELEGPSGYLRAETPPFYVRG